MLRLEALGELEIVELAGQDVGGRVDAYRRRLQEPLDVD
jgi:hypothetical protein